MEISIQNLYAKIAYSLCVIQPHLILTGVVTAKDIIIWKLKYPLYYTVNVKTEVGAVKETIFPE